MIDFKKLLNRRPQQPQQLKQQPRTNARQIINQLYYTEYCQMSDSQFDPSVFLDSTINEPSVRRPPLPIGTEIVGKIGEPKVRSGQQKADPSKTWTTVDLPIEFDLTSRPELMAIVGGVDKLVITDGCMLDITPAGTIDNSPGKNAKMRRYREATGLNQPGQAFSFRMLQGRLVKAKIKHRLYEGEAYDDIDAVAAP